MRDSRRMGMEMWATFLVAGCLLLVLVSPLFASEMGVAVRPRPLADDPWSQNERVDDDSGRAVQYWPSLAVDPRGNAYAVWRDERGDCGIYFSYRPVCGSWGPSVRVDNAGTAPHITYPSIAVDPRGNAYAVWLDNRDGEYNIYFSYRPADGKWGTDVKVNDTPMAAPIARPHIAVDAQGNAYVAWGYDGIYFSYRPAGGAWGSSTTVNDIGGMDSIAVDPSGNAYLIWTENRIPFPGVYFSYRPAGGSWGPKARVDDDTGSHRRQDADIAVDANGNAYAVWDDWRSGRPVELYFAYRPAGGAWSANVKVNDDGTLFTNLFGSIAVSPGGDAYVAWVDRRNGNWDPDIYFSYRPPGGSWGPNGRVNDDAAGEGQGAPSVAVDASGNAYAAWADYRDGYRDGDIYFSYLGSRVPALGDLVWHDMNLDGIQDAGEPGVEGVRVDLFAAEECGGAPFASDVTDANGNYLFCVDPGTYCAEFSNVPPGWTFTSQDQGEDDALDSDANPATGRIRSTVIVEGAGTLDRDVGLLAPEEFVPELGTLALLGSGLAGLAGYARWRWRRR